MSEQFTQGILHAPPGGLIAATDPAVQIGSATVNPSSKFKAFEFQLTAGEYEDLDNLSIKVSKAGTVTDAVIITGGAHAYTVTAFVARPHRPFGRPRGVCTITNFSADCASVYVVPTIDTFVTEVSQDTWIYFPWDMGFTYQEPIAKGAPG